jgi:hypothetical protein
MHRKHIDLSIFQRVFTKVDNRRQRAAILKYWEALVTKWKSTRIDRVKAKVASQTARNRDQRREKRVSLKACLILSILTFSDRSLTLFLQSCHECRQSLQRHMVRLTCKD